MKLLIFLTLALFLSHFGLRQSAAQTVSPVDSCETVSAKLDRVGGEFNKKGTEQSFLIILGRFPSNRMNSARVVISDAVQYLTKFHKAPRERIQYGIASVSKPTGELEFFVNGESSTVVKVGGKRLCFGAGEVFDRSDVILNYGASHFTGKAMRDGQPFASPPATVWTRNVPDQSLRARGAVKCFSAKGRERELCEFIMPIAYRDDDDSAKAFEIRYARADLNDDKVDELIVWESSWAGTSGGSLWIVGDGQTEFTKLFETYSAWSPILVVSRTNNGWRDVAYLVAGGGLNEEFVTISHDGKVYVDRQRKSTDQPKGKVVVEKEWRQSTFGPIRK